MSFPLCFFLMQVRNDLENTFKQVQKYCVSFAGDTNGVDCQAVNSYETSIARWTNTIKDQVAKGFC